MALDLWVQWSHQDSDRYAWIDHWLDQHPGVGASLLAVPADSAEQPRLWYLREPGEPAQVRVQGHQSAEPLAVDDSLYRELTSKFAAPNHSAHALTDAVYWLPAGALRVHPLPLVQEGRVAYWLWLTDFPAPVTAAMLAELNLRAALGLGSARLFEVEQQRRMQHAAVNNLAEVQRMLQPHQPQINGLEYALHWQPAETAAGDYYDVMPLSAAFSEVYDGSAGDVWGAMIGDVSGHGAAAAMEAAQFDAILRTYKPNSDLGPAGALGYANRYFFSRQSRQRLMTVLATRYRPDTRELVYANAGHLPLLVRRGNEVTVYDDGDIPIGVLREQQFRNFSLDLAPGDLVLMYTDGVIEARDAERAEFGLERLSAIFAQGPTQPQALLEVILAALFDHQGGPIGSDDQTVVVLRVVSPGALQT